MLVLLNKKREVTSDNCWCYLKMKREIDDECNIYFINICKEFTGFTGSAFLLLTKTFSPSNR